MTRKINIFLSVSFLIALSVFLWIKFNRVNEVGRISFDSEKDNLSFKLCDSKKIYQYYSTGTSYEGGRKAIRDDLFSQLGSTDLNFSNKSGHITIRFVVNCKGEIGWFRVKMIDELQQSTNFDLNTITNLTKAIKTLKNWNSGKVGDIKIDSYYQIIFKIKDGEIKNIF